MTKEEHEKAFGKSKLDKGFELWTAIGIGAFIMIIIMLLFGYKG